MQLIYLEEMMKVKPQICRTCKYYQELPFTEHQMYCMNSNSEYADCECEDHDTCEEWIGNEDEENA